jgi:RHS repeat-associated protein
MSASVLYTNFGGMLVHEDRGGVERTYVHDEMGNTSYLVDSNGVTDSYEYTPYGQVTHTGVSVTPFTFIGALGYFATGWSMLTSYVRARWYSRVSGSWGSVDPLWPWQKAYQYVDGNPAMGVDPSGLIAIVIVGGIVITAGMIATIQAIVVGITLAVLVWLILHALAYLQRILCGKLRKAVKDVCGDPEDRTRPHDTSCGGCKPTDPCATLRNLMSVLCYADNEMKHWNERMANEAQVLQCMIFWYVKGCDGGTLPPGPFPKFPPVRF